MPSYNLNGLGPVEFERLAQALIKQVIGLGTVTFGAGRDGAREATFIGRAPYPSATEQWRGKWIFQVKFHDTMLLGIDKARRQIVADIDRELHVITGKYQYDCDNYIMITNVPLTSIPVTGTRAKIESEAFSKYSRKIRNFAIWGAEEISRYLEVYPQVRTAFLHFIVPGDLIAKLLTFEAERADEVSRTIQTYIRAAFLREQNAQLDQAGDVSDEPVRLQQVFFDLTATPESDASRISFSDPQRILGPARHGGTRGLYVVRLMLAEGVDRAVLIGGPGEGKSTVGQYLAQLHRATLLQKAEDIALSNEYLPSLPRLPFRVILKDYGQWLAEKTAVDSNSGAIDRYLCDHVETLSARKIEPAALHRIIGNNPILLILDGLDEVTDTSLKKLLLDRVVEFTDRCVAVYNANLQILATTRPTGYVEQFDPKSYVHLRLQKLDLDQVTSYVKRWTEAKEFDAAKARRVQESIQECVADPQIRLLVTTPLQVTILAVIVAVGGTPPRQREALFNEYLEVIYKRETAKGRYIIQSEKERLIGLHRYVGYILHEKATEAQAMGAVLEREDYERLVSTFLRFQNPYAPEAVIELEHRGITRDAGDRLVLIVEPVLGKFGFELRSIQEFFAACHLLDTSNSTEQRYRRFEAISRLTHWRNVALFFAGRTGRNYPGEVFNLVEVCRAVDREGADRYLRRGSELALELAADRAFAPNAVGQRSLLEHGLLILDSDLSVGRRIEVCDVLQRLPEEDIRDHIVPLLRQRIQMFEASRMENVAHASNAVAATELVLGGR